MLGSSTAAGVGPSTAASAWVERYRTYLANDFRNFNLVNLAVPGYSTWDEQPDDFQPPQGRPAPDVEHNISAALRMNPSAILINLPANDTATDTTFEEQMDNLARMTALADRASVMVWVATTQPRNFALEAQRMLQMQVRDAINIQYGNLALDFWTPLAEVDGTIKSIYDSGDGTHMNDAAHALMAQKVIDAMLPETILARP